MVQIKTEPGLEVAMDDLLRRDGFVPGLVIGRANATAWSVVHLVPTPSGEDDDAAEAPVALPTSVQHLDVAWIMEHHKQVTRLLPGGIDVIGVFFVDKEDVFQSTAGMAHCRKLLKAMSERENNEQKELLIAHGNKGTGKWSFKVLSSSAASAAPKNADHVMEKEALRWHRMNGTFILDIPVVFDLARTTLLLAEKIEIALKPVEKNLDKAMVLFDQRLRRANELLNPSDGTRKDNEGGKGKKKGKKQQNYDEEEREDDDKTFVVEVLLDEDVTLLGDGITDECVTETVHSRMRLAGRMAVCAFVPSGATVAEATRAVATDIMRSLKGRCEMHCDSLVVGDEASGTEGEAPTLHEPPRRILIKLPSSTVCVSDYLYPGENPEDSVESVEEVLGFKPRIEDMDDELETVASPQETLNTDSEGSRPASPDVAKSLKAATSLPLPIIGVSAAIAFLGIILAYIYLT